jgi:hypothetical protein
MTKSKRRRATLPQGQAILFKLQMTRWRQKAWREKPDHMEAIRKRATEQAKAVKEWKHLRLVQALMALPDRMTHQELDDLFLKSYLTHKQVTRDSFFKRVKRRGLLTFDPADGCWVNLTREVKA